MRLFLEVDSSELRNGLDVRAKEREVLRITFGFWHEQLGD